VLCGTSLNNEILERANEMASKYLLSNTEATRSLYIIKVEPLHFLLEDNNAWLLSASGSPPYFFDFFEGILICLGGIRF
jgi:hypothetical protein